MVQREELEELEELEIPDFWNMENWLVNKIYDKSGGFYSWQRENDKGYLYSEITGYGIKLYMYLYSLFKDPKYLLMAKKSVDYLNSKMYNGGISRSEICYVFDTSICLSGILSYDAKSIDKNMIKFVYHNLLMREPIRFNGTIPVVDLNHWSLSYGSHLLKCNIILKDLLGYTKDPKFGQLIDRICADNLKNFDNGHFHINSKSTDVYVHSHCYATEGLIYINRPEYSDIIKQSARWLADSQNSDGSLYNWYNSSRKQEKRTDITAQAIRIWLWADKEKFDSNIKKGFKFLKSLQSPEGGLYYSTVSSDINSWATIFAMNAVLWHDNGVDIKWLI